MVAVRCQAGANPQSAVGRQYCAHARPVYCIRHVDVARDLTVNRVANSRHRLVALNAHEHLAGRELYAHVLGPVVVTTEVQHDLQHLVAVVCRTCTKQAHKTNMSV